MIDYFCHRCGYNTNKKCNIIQHLNRKNVCKPILDNIDIEYIKKCYNLKIKQMTPNDPNSAKSDPKLTPNDPKLTPNEKLHHKVENIKILPKHICEYCNKEY